MRVLFFGDVVGTEATQVLARHMDEWRAETRADVVVANVENALVTQLEDPLVSYGLDDELATTLLNAGADILTGGNHSWDKLAPDTAYQRENVLRPHNMVEPSPGRGVFTREVKGRPFVVVNLIGYTALYPPLKARKALDVFEELTFPKDAIVLVDLHAERVIEKRTFTHAIDGRASLVVGTHTHEPTLRLEQFPNGTFFCSDAGMCGPSLGVVGMGPEWYVRQMRGKTKPGFTLASGPIQIGAIVLDTEAEKLERFLPDL
ncbi:MAG: YmdB family metallophosphoesterase [Vulcanimicrobiaceae bacterium]|jgi:metallophosphoesterase (TIGR00282 family)